MPNGDTFDVPIIADFVKKYLRISKVSVDPFSRNKRWATHTNDLNPTTSAEHHLDAEDFLINLKKEKKFVDMVILDPPYSPRQIQECYASFGKKCSMEDTQNARLMSNVRKGADAILQHNGIVLSFGWNSVGMGAGYETEEIMLVCHGSAHNDTICMAERKIVTQSTLDLEYGMQIQKVRNQWMEHAISQIHPEADIETDRIFAK